MEKLNLKLKVTKQSRYDLIAEIAKRLNLPIGRLLGETKGISHEDIDELYRSANSLCLDAGLSFGKSWNWHFREFKKSLTVDN